MGDESAAKTIRALLIESRDSRASPAAVLARCAPDRQETGTRFDVLVANDLDEGLRLLDRGHVVDVILFVVDASEPRGPAAWVRLRKAVAHLPIIVLAETSDKEQAEAAIRQGIQDWLPRGALTESMLASAVRHAIERFRIDLELRARIRRLERARARTHRQAAELRARAKELDATNRELDDFVYVASHDLKEPLRGIKAYCELFVEDYQDRLDTIGVNRLRTVAGMCGRLERQISDLLTYYRVGRMPSPPAPVDLMEVVDGQVAAFRPLLDRRGASVRVKGPLPCVLGHPLMLGLIVGNLISNGLKYNRSERPKVEIGAVVDQPATIYVRDNGIGIAPEHHEAVFGLFRRLHGPKEFEGTGAGLTIVRKIVQSYKGRIWLESEPGRGTTFFVF
ncbi:MAG TPA: hypothetical protein DD670_05575, partial [Planctomycetaceae bacterium]|nr:hypothetical protein [Planctomycetaceae bacterium]